MFAAAAATSMAVAAAGVCPYHQTSIVRPLVNNDLQIDLNNNAETGMRLRNENNGNNNSGETAMLAHGRQRQAQIFVRKLKIFCSLLGWDLLRIWKNSWLIVGKYFWEYS